jgi:hypothetical protein
MSDADMAVSTEWLARNARHLGDENWPDTKDTSQRSRAVENFDDALIAPEEGMGRYQVELPDGEPHQCLIVKAGDSYAGACDCDGYQYHDLPCSHLLTLRVGEFSDRVDVPESHDYVMELANDDAQPEKENENEPSEDLMTEDTDTTPVTKESTQTTPTPPQQSDDAFAKDLPDVDKQFVLEMGGEKYIRKAGYARLLCQLQWRPVVERDVRAKDTEYERAEVTAKIVDSDGNVRGEAIGTAGPPDREDMTNADMHLDELAETRAWTRAASIATGEGLTAFAELPEKASEVVGE